MEWIRSQRFDSEVRVKGWDDDVARFAESCEPTRDLYRALQALKGVSAIVAATLVAESGDLRRFARASHLMSYLGLSPSEHSSGSKVSRGARTKAGNTHVRYKLVQAAWNYSSGVRCGRRALGDDGPGQAIRKAPVLTTSTEQASRHASSISSHQLFSNERPQTTIVSIARELCGFIWERLNSAPPPAGTR